MVTTGFASGPGPTPRTPGEPSAALLVRSTVLAVIATRRSVMLAFAPALSAPTAVEVAVIVALKGPPVEPAAQAAFPHTRGVAPAAPAPGVGTPLPVVS